MVNKKKIIIIVIIVIVAVVCSGGLYYYLAFINNSGNNSKNTEMDMNNPAYVAEMNSSNNNVNKEDEITRNEVVDSNINNLLSAKISEKVNLLNDVKLDNIKIYKANNSGSTNTDNPLIQESTYNNIENTINNSDNNSQNNNFNNFSDIQNNNGANNSENVNVILDLTLKPSSDNMETVRQDMETKANNLAVSIANEKPNIMTSIVNFGVDGRPNAKASFTFERSGNNMFLQEFMMSSDFN